MAEKNLTPALKPRIVELPALEFTGVERSYQELQSENNGFCTLWTKHFPERQPAILPGSVERTGYGVYRMSNKADRLTHPESFAAAMKTDGKKKGAQWVYPIYPASGDICSFRTGSRLSLRACRQVDGRTCASWISCFGKRDLL